MSLHQHRFTPLPDPVSRLPVTQGQRIVGRGEPAHNSRVFPIRSSCIMPCLICRIFSQRTSRTMIDVDGFVRYQDFGKGDCEENEEEIQELLSERDKILSCLVPYLILY